MPKRKKLAAARIESRLPRRVPELSPGIAREGGGRDAAR
jgi:hypothetical protein